jgi:hypothetical protein
VPAAVPDLGHWPPAPVPGVAAPRPPVAEAPVSDEDRNRFGVLLDHAAERGLLSPGDYQIRLAELAEASTREEMQRIVTELPAFDETAAAVRASRARNPLPTATSAAPAGLDGDAILWANRTPATARRRSGNPWVFLAVLVIVLVVALVALALVAAHVSHAHHAGPAGAVALSPLRL